MQKFENIGEAPVSSIMQPKVICVKPSYSIKTTIETFRVHQISCAPVITDDGKIYGIISEHDLLIQAGSTPIEHSIDFKKQVTAVFPESTIKEVLMLFFSKRLKHAPVLDHKDHVIGIVSRIDLLNYLATNAS